MLRYIACLGLGVCILTTTVSAQSATDQQSVDDAYARLKARQAARKTVADVQPPAPKSDPDVVVPVLIATIPEQIAATPNKLTASAPVPTSPPVELITADQVGTADTLHLVAPYPLDACKVEESGTSVKIGRASAGGLTQKVTPLAEIRMEDGKILWQWKATLDSSEGDKKIADWLHLAVLQLLKGDQRLAALQFCATEERTMSLNATEPQKVPINASSALLSLTAITPVPAGWQASHISKGTALKCNDTPNVRFTVEYDAAKGAVSTTWKTAFLYATSKKADAELDVRRLNTELDTVRQQKTELQRTMGGYTGDISDANQRRVRDEYAELQARELSIPRDVSSKTAQAADWDKRAAALATVEPFESSLQIKANGVVLYHFKFSMGAVPEITEPNDPIGPKGKPVRPSQ